MIELLTKECKKLHKVMEDSLNEISRLEGMIQTLKDNNNVNKKQAAQEQKEQYDDEEEQEGPDEM